MEMLADNNLIGIFTNPHNLIMIGGLILLLVIIYLETGFFLGLILPGGDYLVFTSGLLAGTHFLDISIFILVPSMIGAAILGDFTGYAKGKWLGNKLFDKEENKYFKKSYILKSEQFYQKYGMGAFILGRFLPVVRTLMPMLAGASGLSLKRFSLYNVLGAVIWIGSLAPLGYILGNIFPGMINYSIYFLVGFVILASAPVLITFFKPRKTSAYDQE
jgi:membrane-associated protein